MLVFNPEILAKSIDTENNEIVFEDLFMIEKSEKSNPDDPKFEYFKKLVMDHLAELEKKENKTIAKAIDICEYIQKSKFPVGTVRNWNGGKFKKISPNKWVRVYNKETRGAKIAIAWLRRKAAACTSSDELLQLVLANKERFVDNAGKPLPFMQEFSAYVSGLNDKNAAKESPETENIDSAKKMSDKEFDERMHKWIDEINAGDAKDPDKIVSKIAQRFADTQYIQLDDPFYQKFLELGKNAEKYVADYLQISDKDKKVKSDKTLAQIKAAFESKSKEELEQNIKYLQRNARADDSMMISLADSEKMPIKDAIKLLKEIQEEKGGEKPKPYYSKEVWEKLKKLDKETAEKNAALGLASSGGSNGNGSTYLEYLEGVLKRAKLNAENGIESVRKENKKDIPIIEAAIKEEKKKTNPPKSDNEPKKKGIESIRNKYQSSKSIEGDEDEIYVGKEAITGKWKLVEADAPSASHDEITFRKTEGFPTGKDGATVNDRDYEHDTAAQEAVIDIAADYDGRALGLDSPVIVTQDGVVTSGNNRTMSSKIAARKGTDTKYIEALKKRAGKFGFTADDVAQFKHPRVVFETEHKGDYTTSEFAKFNESGKKAMNPVEKAVKVSKLIKSQTVEQIAENISEFDTMGDLYADKKATRDIFNTLIESDIIQKTDLPQYYADNAITAAGKEFLETVLIGSVVDENNIRQLNTEGGKSIRQKLVRAITPLIENKGMKGYSINKELNEAVGIAVEVAHNKDKFADVEDYGRQTDMFRKLDPVSIELVKKLEGTQKSFAEFMLEMNGGLRPAANGEADIFLGGTESKEDIVNRILHIKKAVQKALKSFISHIFDK